MLYGNHRTEPTNVQQPRCAIRFRETIVVCLWAVGSWCDVIHAISSEVRQSAYSLAGCRAEAASGETAGPSHYHSRPLWPSAGCARIPGLPPGRYRPVAPAYLRHDVKSDICWSAGMCWGKRAVCPAPSLSLARRKFDFANAMSNARLAIEGAFGTIEQKLDTHTHHIYEP